MDDIYRILAGLELPGKKVLATIVSVAGSAYKKEGSSMLFLEDGSEIGMLSAGCLETDLALQVQKVSEQRESVLIQYEMSAVSDFSWGQGPGCNGIIDILLEPITEKLAGDLLIVKSLLESNIAVLALKRLKNLGEYAFIPSEGEPIGEWSGRIPVEFSGVKSGRRADLPIFQHLFRPKPRLIVFGAGPDAKPLVSLGSEVGFAVTVYDWREAFCQEKNFPTADQLVIGFPNELLNRITFTSNDFVVIMSHDFQKDQEILLAVQQENIKYLGVLGPRERTKRLLNQNEIPDWIYSPIGMSIGAKGPEEIAVSVVAEMIDCWRRSSLERVDSLWSIPE